MSKDPYEAKIHGVGEGGKSDLGQEWALRLLECLLRNAGKAFGRWIGVE